MRVVVVGAGLGGVAAAVGLHRAGHDVLLCERAAELRELGTAIAIPPNGLRALDALGLSEHARAHTLSAVTGGLRDWRGRPLLVTELERARRTVGTLSVVSRAELHRSLRAPLPADRVRTATWVRRLEPSGSGVSVIGDGGPVATADVVIVADGIGSSLRGRMFPAHPGIRRTGRLDLRGMLPRPSGLDVTELLAGILIDRRRGVSFGLFPVGENDLYWYTDSPLRGDPPGPAEARRALRDATADWHPVVPALIEATAPADIHVDAVACLAEPLPSFAIGRIALLGDAAHAMVPDLGQGASQAFEDAVSITRHLTGAGPDDVEERLRRYDAERRPRTSRLMLQASRQSWLTSRTGITAWLRDAALRAIPNRLASRQLASLWQV
ncbi:FAD-dependent monooxygenase [Thermomonospora amylolytica]|uniref:FAD-dependent monooxygenase n=1 Tax=Thermomonospora amylolytica TaxID=1411117 RepID=UPI000E6D2599|nr:FAD-dependent monooxygenase [Thermomonospora amylolytica]